MEAVLLLFWGDSILSLWRSSCAGTRPPGWVSSALRRFPQPSWLGQGTGVTGTNSFDSKKNECRDNRVAMALHVSSPFSQLFLPSGGGSGAWARREAWASWPASSSELPSPPGSSDCRWGGLAVGSPHCTARRALAPGRSLMQESCTLKGITQRTVLSSGQWPKHCWQPHSIPSQGLCSEGPQSWDDYHWQQDQEMTAWSGTAVGLLTFWPSNASKQRGLVRSFRGAAPRRKEALRVSRAAG